MSPLTSTLVAMIPVGIVLVLLIVHYERQLKIMREQRDNSQKNLNDALSKLMAVDYEKLRAMEITAQADAQIAWTKHPLTYEDQLVQDPTEVEIPNAYPARS